jgi:broad specificity phosphatase PhoE
MTSITIVRHGNTFAPGEVPRRIGARTDLPLVESGRAQAIAIGRAFAADGTRFARVLCSPLRRTRETAALILAGIGGNPAMIEPCAWLAEIDHGPDEDAPEAEVVARIGADALARWDDHGIAPPGWIVDAGTRIAGWRAILAKHDAGDTLLVTSNGAARFALLADDRLADTARARGSFRLRTGAWGTIVLDRGIARLAAWDVRP